MPSSNSSSPEPTFNSPNPLEPIEQLAHWLTAAAVHGVLGVVIGLIAVRLMHHRHLRWTWAATALGVDVLAGPVLGGLTWPLGIAALCATVRGHRWHREEVEAGADLAELAASRRGPLDALRTVVRRTLPKLLARWALTSAIATARQDWFRGDRLIVGEEEHGRTVSIPLGGPTGGTHTLVVGATRSGKTVTMTWMSVRAIEHGMGAIVVDPKGDRDLCRELRNAALTAGRQFIEWTPQGPAIYNPYARGSETEIADKVLAGERFTEPHYLRQAQRYLGHEVRTLRKAGLEVSLKELVRASRSAAAGGARADPARVTGAGCARLPGLAHDAPAERSGGRARPSVDHGRVRHRTVARFRRRRACSDSTCCEAAKAQAVVYFNLEADRRPLLAQMLGAAIVGDLQAMVAALQGRPVGTLVVIDEFSAIVPERVVGLFARAGGAGVSLVLGTQELADLRVPGRETVHDQVMGSLSTLIAHRQVVPASAELIASMTETRGVWRTSQHSEGSADSHAGPRARAAG